MDSASATGRITSLHYHPIKGCHAVTADAVTLTPLGIRHDREWMVVDAATRTFLSQRQRPAMALLHPRIEGEELVVTTAAGDRKALRIPTDSPRAVHSDDPEVTVWGAPHPALDAGDESAAWFSEVLGTPCRLVRVPADYARRPNPKYAAPEDRVGFQDGWPLLVTNTASLDDLNARLTVPVGMERFRPNIVVSGGLSAWAEERWKALSVRTAGGDITLRAVKLCARCSVTTIDQETGEAMGPEPLATLARQYRSEEGKVNFGMNCTPDPAHPGTLLRVGDPVTFL